nr:hypothetical protein 4 [Desulfobacteraceae bacterium]
MSADLCLFCNGLEIKYKPETGNNFICSRCVQMLLVADQQDLKKAHARAIQKGFTNKASAIESFLISEDKIDGQRKPAKKRGRHSNRKRIVRIIRDKAKRIGRAKIPA